MSFMKKMLPPRPGPPVEGPGQTPDTTLGLMHLRKLFAEFRHPTTKVTQKEQEDKLYNMLPLFCKVFENAPSSDMTEKWGDILQFCSHVSKLMVTEIRRRASNQSTEAASRAIVELLEVESGVDNGNGWLLLNTINLLSLGGQALIDCMTAASLPSTLVKCLYLLFDLPPVEDSDTLPPGCQFSPNERRILLQKVFVQVLVRLCNYVSPAEELARKDDLSLLFSAITSWCVPHNIPWRQSAGEVLVTLSRHGLTPSVVKYIHDKGCVRRCVENMQRAQDLSPLELVEMFVTVFCFLKDSSEVSQTLLDDFKACQGYNFLADFLLRLEQDEKEESVQALRNLVLLVGSLTTCGFTELRPTTSNSDSLFHLPGFVVPQPMGKGVSVRNIQAFQVLQSVFIKSETSQLCSTILDVLSSIYHQDTANYFILESQNTLSQFAEKIFLKPQDIQNKFFELLEFVVFNLNFVPCKELISLSILIKTQPSLPNSILCMKTLLRILRYHVVYRDVFREVGILEVMVTCLHRYAAHLKEIHTPSPDTERRMELSEDQQELGHLVMEALSVLLTGNSSNAGVFHQCGGARCAHNMVPYPECRQQALNIVQQLVLSPGGDDDMGTLLGLMPTVSITDLELKTHILKSLLNVLRESHRTRTVFRKVGGFVYVMSVLVSMEGSLEDPPKSPWNAVARRDVLNMLHTVFSTLTVAMRYEPANAKFFTTEVRYDSLTEAVRLLGCFSSTIDIPASQEPYTSDPESDVHVAFSELFAHSKEEKLKVSLPPTLASACTMLRYLYDMSLDAFDRPSHLRSDSPCLRKYTSMSEEGSGGEKASGMRPKRSSTGSMGLSLNGQPDPVVVHAGAVLSIFHLLPAIEHQDSKLALELQLFTASMLKSLLRPERNQQILCDSGLPHELLSHASAALTDETHPLHPPLQHMFERLASQSLTPRDLRDFLRLGSPLSCRSVEEEYQDQSSLPWHDPDIISWSVGMEEKEATMDTERKLQSAGRPVPLTRIKCLVSMTTPRDARMHGASVTPAFVEFDMAAEGFACLYLPSIAPQGPPTPSVVGGVVGTSEPVVIGGIGTGERVFPPQSGLTLSTWFCVDKFSNAGSDGHPVRLLTVVRNIQGRDENLICLSVFLTSRDRALIVTTQESYMPVSGNGCEFEQDPGLSDNTVRFWCPELTQEGQWHHLMLIFHRAGIMKNSSVSLFVDGDHVDTQKLHYISPNLGGGGTASPSAFTSVFAYIGSPPQLRRQSRLSWRQGPLYLLEDIVSSSVISSIYRLGPTYVGSLQAPLSEENELCGPFISEEKVMLAVHAHAMCQLTVAKVRKVYNKVDSKSIAKQLAMSAHENATPIRILHNAAGHLAGPARSLGAVLMGYLGVRTFCPKPVARMLENVGGTSCLLGLIAMATDVEGLYAAVKALVCVVRSNHASMWDMDRIRGYQLLAMLYKKKTSLLNSHILHLTFSLVGSLDSGRESAIIPNKVAFEDLLCDLEVWHKAPGDLQRSLYEHFYELLTDSSESKTNCELMRGMGLVTKLLTVLRDPQLSLSTTNTIASVICELLTGAPDPHGLLRLGHFLVSTMPRVTFAERSLDLQREATSEQNNTDNGTAYTDFRQLSMQQSISGDGTTATQQHNVRVRNILLEVVLKLVLPPGSHTINQTMCEELQRVLGFDWLLLFMQGHLHPTTVQLALNILVATLRSPENTRRFREGTHRGGWLADTENVLKNQMAIMLGFNVGAGAKESAHEVNMEVCCVPGFQVLQWLLPHHTHIPAVFFLLMKLMLGQHTRELPDDIQLSLDAVWTVIFGVPASKPVVVAREQVDLCPDAAMVILAMVRSMLNQLPAEDCMGSSSPHRSPPGSVDGEEDHPTTLIQFLMYLYINVADFRTLCMAGEFITALVATLFPYPLPDYSSDVTTPNEEYKPFPDSEPAVLVKSLDKDMFNHLTPHPARRVIIDFLRMLVIDSFSQQTTKLGAVLDVMLEAAPDHASRAQQREFQTTMLSVLMEHLLAADVLLGEQAALPLASTNAYTTIAHSVFYFASRVVDKLWHGVYTRDSKEVFDFISKLISQSKRKSFGLSLDSIYRCLNRTILFQLSRPVDSVAGQAGILEALHTLTNNRSLVFGPSNSDHEFLGCLCFCLLHLTDNPETGVNSLSERQPRATTWHVESGTVDLSLVGDNGGPGTHTIHAISSTDTFQPEPLNAALKEGLKLVAHAAHRVWDELYIHKKPALEEIFKTQLNNITSNTKTISTPELSTVRPLIQESASKMWVTYAENERKSSFLQTEKLQNQIQSKLQRMGSGVLRLASRKTKRELPIKASPVSNVHRSDFMMWTASHVDLVKEVVTFQYDQFMQGQKHMERYLLEEWQQVEKELLRERSLWGPAAGSRLQRWMLDMTEGPGRMRKKMTKNELFYIHYPYRPDLEDNPLRYKVAISFDSREYYENFRPQGILCHEALPIQRTSDADLLSTDADQTPSSPEDIIHMRKLLPRSTSSKSTGDEEEAEDSSALDSGTQAGETSGETAGEGNTDGQGDAQQEEPVSSSNKDNQTIMRFLGDKEKISHMFRCARIQGLDTAEGLLLFGREHFYIIDGFTLLRTKEIKDIDSLPYEIHDPIIPKSSMGSVGPTKRLFSKFAYDDIREVHKRRYLLQPIAIEAFSGDGRNHLLAFPRKIRNKVFAKFLSVATAITDNAQTSVSGQRQNAKVESGGGLISSLIGEKSVTQRWERGEINNFQYLMHLNTLAGRSYNDLMQYPVFPWIIADYDSLELDFSQPSTFRDLTKPMGAQTPDRLKQFQKRYNEWDDPQGETPPYHYGTHYSSAMIVASYLVRMEPFTQHFLKLQGGHFDLADRMFHSVRENWLSASKHNMADVKELIPEFFYLPDLLLNKNNFDLGCKQNGVQLDDVILPPWAKGDAREFIRLHRQALESDYVSAHLHEWIDLIFGYKQRGPSAVDANNVFHYLFYEGNVDIYSIQDPLKKNATIGFINNFGQIPKQLFKKPHPPKRLSARLLETLPLCASTGIAADQRLFFHHVDNLKPSMQPIKELKTAVGQIIHTDRYVLAVEQNKVLVPPNYSRYLAWGFADLSLRVGPYESEKAIAIFEGLDNGEILCASCPHDKLFVTGGTSCVVRVWEYSGKDRRACLKQPLYGHTEPVTCLTTSPAYNVIVTGSRDRTCIIWDMSRLVYVHQLRGHVAPVAAVCVNELTGDIATCAGTYLHLWNINGEAIASINTATGRNQQILCVTMSQFMEWDAQNVILTGSSDGVVRMWSVEYVQVAEEKEVTAAAAESAESAKSSGNKSHSASSTSSKPLLARKLSRHESCDSYACEERSAADLLKDFKDPDFLAVRECELGSSGEQDSPLSQRMKSQDAAEREGQGGMSEYPRDNISATSSLSDLCGAEDPAWENGSGKSATTSVDTGIDALAALGEGSQSDLEARSGNKQSSSQSEPCLSGMSSQQDAADGRSVSHDGLQPGRGEPTGAGAERASPGSGGPEVAANPAASASSAKDAEDVTAKYRPLGKNTLREGECHSVFSQNAKYSPLGKKTLREGFRWQRQLMFRSKLTMHTAFERKDNKEPAAVTAVAISKDHKTVYVGDGRGRIFSWTVTDQPGRVAADHWMKDEGVESCPVCNVRFSFAERRHHCRNCGKVFCSKCSRYETEIRRLRMLKPVRVCLSCYNILRAQQAADSLAQASGRG